MVQAPQAPENQEQEHFGGLSTGGLALPTAYYVRDVDFSTVEVQRYLEELGAEIVALDGVNQETPVGCNHWVPALRNVEHQTRWSRDCLEFLRVFWCFLQVAKHYSDIFRHIIQKSSVHHVQNMFFPSSPHEKNPSNTPGSRSQELAQRLHPLGQQPPWDQGISPHRCLRIDGDQPNGMHSSIACGSHQLCQLGRCTVMFSFCVYNRFCMVK